MVCCQGWVLKHLGVLHVATCLQRLYTAQGLGSGIGSMVADPACSDVTSLYFRVHGSEHPFTAK